MRLSISVGRISSFFYFDDLRVSVFGPLFSGVLIVSLLLLSAAPGLVNWRKEEESTRMMVKWF